MLMPPEYLDGFINRDSYNIEEIYEILYDYISQIYRHISVEELSDYTKTPMFSTLERAMQNITRKSSKWNRRFYELFNKIYSKIKQVNIDE